LGAAELPELPLLPLVFASLCPAIHQADMMAFYYKINNTTKRVEVLIDPGERSRSI
jgi:hypothetical protein